MKKPGFIIFILFLGYGVYGQWDGGNPWTGADPEIQNLSPDIIFDNNNIFPIASLIFQNSGVTEARFIYNKDENIFALGGNTTSILETLFTLDIDGNNNGVSSNGFLTLGARNDFHLSFDNDDIQARNGSTTASTLSLNRWGGNVDIGDGSLFYGVTLDRVGVNTTSPRRTFDVNGDIALSDGNGSIWFYEGTTLKARIDYGGTDLVIKNQEIGDADIIIDATNRVLFNTGGSQAVSIMPSGNVGIKTSNPLFDLDVNGDAYFRGTSYIYSSGTNNPEKTLFAHSPTFKATYKFYYHDISDQFRYMLGGNDILSITETGVGVNTTSSAFDFQVAGDVDITGELTAASDARLKEHIEPLEGAVEVLKNLNPVSYQFRTEEFPNLNLPTNQKMGLLAQEVETVLPQLVKDAGTTTKSDGEELAIKSVNYIEIIPLLIKANQELSAQNEELLKRIEALESKVN